MALSKEYFAKMRDAKKRIILQEALVQFSDKGLYATRIKDIAGNAGIAQGLLYNYFQSKEEIYAALLDGALDKLIEATVALGESTLPARALIRESIARLLETIEESDEFCQTCRFISQATTSSAIPEEAKRAIAEKRGRPYEIIAGIMARGQREGAVVDGDPSQLAVLFWTTISGLAIYRASREERVGIPRAALVERMFLKDMESEDQ